MPPTPFSRSAGLPPREARRPLSTRPALSATPPDALEAHGCDDVGFEAVVERARAGDPRAFEEVAAAYAPSLLRFTTAVLSGDLDAAHDVVQDVLVAAWRSLPTLEEPRFLRAWLFRVAHRRAVSWIRHRSPRGAPFVTLFGHGLGDANVLGDRVALARPEPPSSETEAAAAQGLRGMLGEIPERYASPIALCYLVGLGVKETARVLGMPESTLKMRLHRGRRLLRRRIAREEGWSLHRRVAGTRVDLPSRDESRVPRRPA